MTGQLLLFPEPAAIIHPVTVTAKDDGEVEPVAIPEGISLPDPVPDAPARPTAPAPAIEAPEPVEMILPDGVRIVRWEPVEPPIRLSQSEVVIGPEFVRTTLRQLSHELHGNHWLSGHWGQEELIRRLMAVGVEIEIDDPERGDEK